MNWLKLSYLNEGKLPAHGSRVLLKQQPEHSLGQVPQQN